MYSAYAGLKAGGVYWPIITATLLSMGSLRLLGEPDLRQANLAGTGASTGGLLAAGVIFTLPAAWLLDLEISILEVCLVALAGGLLGVLFTVPLREEMIERLELPYPDGTATGEILRAGDAGGRPVRALLAWFGVGGLFAAARDAFGLLPQVVNLETLAAGSAGGSSTGGGGWAGRAAERVSFGSSITLVSLAGGFLIGPKFTGVWFLGGVISYLVAVPWLLAAGRFPDKGAAIAAATRPFGIGLIVGASVAYFFLKGLPSFLPAIRRLARARGSRRILWAATLVVLIGVLSVTLDLPLWLTVVAVLGAFLVAYIAARIAGELNIDPMEIFAIALLVTVLLFVRLEPGPAVIFAAILCLSAGMAGDFMQDLKAGKMVGTPPREQLKMQVLAVVVAAVALGPILFALRNAYGIGTVDLPAPQAVALAEIVRTGGISAPLAWGAAAGALLTLLSLATGQGILPVAFGIGLYAPIELSLPLFLGGLLRWAAERRDRVEAGRLAAAGVIGGEGFAGVALALGRMATGS